MQEPLVSDWLLDKEQQLSSLLLQTHQRNKSKLTTETDKTTKNQQKCPPTLLPWHHNLTFPRTPPTTVMRARLTLIYASPVQRHRDINTSTLWSSWPIPGLAWLYPQSPFLSLVYLPQLPYHHPYNDTWWLNTVSFHPHSSSRKALFSCMMLYFLLMNFGICHFSNIRQLLLLSNNCNCKAHSRVVCQVN